MTLERLEEIQSDLLDDNLNSVLTLKSEGMELVHECGRLRLELNAIAGKAKEALDER